MIALTGDTRSSTLIKILQKYKIGRMFISIPIKPYKREYWGFDNGAFGDFLKGKEFDRDRYLRNLEKAVKISENYHPPYLAVLPDIVGDGMKSLELSITFLETELYQISFNWYLAVQDGMNPETVEKILKNYPQIKGIFLGGTDSFKETANRWSSLAHSLGRKFHYARAGSMKKVFKARRAKSDSLDSALPLWNGQKLRRFLKALSSPLQLELPLPA